VISCTARLEIRDWLTIEMDAVRERASAAHDGSMRWIMDVDSGHFNPVKTRLAR
jgi:hypothetical protein